MLTYQDLVALGDNEAKRMDFIKTAITEHKNSSEYRKAVIADTYARGKNETIIRYQKYLYTVTGRAVPDNFSSNHKIRSKFFSRFLKQEVQFLLGNGVSWNDDTNVDAKLGMDFDNRLQELGKNALIHGASYGFYDMNRIKVFSLLEFKPLLDEEDGALKAGVRFWQIDNTKPLRATLYELDGFTDYRYTQDKPEGEILHEKRPYILIGTQTDADGVEFYDGKNYESFPIVPLFNEYKQSKLEGLREQIDAYDLIKSGFANDLDDLSQIYWVLSNAGAMDDIDLATFIERMKTTRAFASANDVKVEAHTVEIPYNARNTILDRLRSDLYEDAHAVDTKSISASGAITATAIKASYKPLDEEADEFEYLVLDFIYSILKLAGIEGEAPTFTRNYIVNTTEEVQTLISASTYLPEEYVTKKIVNLLGDGEKVEEILDQVKTEGFERAGFENKA